MNFRSLPRLLQSYIVAVILAGVSTLAVTFFVPHAHSGRPGLSLTLILCSILFSTWKVSLLHGGVMTLTSAPVCLAMLLDGPLTAVLCAFFGALVGTFARPVPGRWRPNFVWDKAAYRPVFNVSICTLAAGISAIVYYWSYDAMYAWAASHWGTRPVPPEIPAQAAGAMAFQGVHFLVNTLGVSVALALQRSQNLFKIWRDNFFWTISSYLTTASIAVAIFVFYRIPGFGIFALIILSPLYWIYKFYRIEAEKQDLYVAKIEHDKRHVEELNELNSSIIASLATAIDAKDRYTRSHINRVQMYAVALGEAIGLSGPDLEAVRTGALIHDIGKLGIPERILGKPGKLTPEEYRRMQAHVTIGVEILAPVRFPYPVIPIVETHHERWDGLGYPKGLRAEDIPVGGRIMAIADVFDALTSDRPYRRALEPKEALNVLREGAGKQFDPHLVARFTEILPEVRVRVEEMESRTSDHDAGEDGPSSADANSAFAMISQAAAEMSAACELAQGLAETSTVLEVLDVVIDRALKLLPVDTAIVYLCQDNGGDLHAEAISGMYADKLAGLTINRGEGVSGWVAETLQPQINAQASLDIARRFNPSEVMELSAAAAVPLVQGGETIGVLTLYTTGYMVLHEHHLGVLNVMAEHAAAGIASARRYEQTRELSLTDPLTGLPNSRSLIHRMETLCAGLEAQPEGGLPQLAVLMLDLDGFKMVNDVLGHLRGDEVLREFGEILRRLCDEFDLPCRYAGDEFVVVLQNAQPAAVEAFTHRVRDALLDRSRHWMSAPVGVSIGTAFAPADGTEVRSLLAVADERMYNDKFRRRTGVGLRGEPASGAPEILAGWSPPTGTRGE